MQDIFLALYMSSNVDWYSYKVSCEDILNGFQVIKWAHFLWWTKFQGKKFKKYKNKSYGSWALHVV